MKKILLSIGIAIAVITGCKSITNSKKLEITLESKSSSSVSGTASLL